MMMVINHVHAIQDGMTEVAKHALNVILRAQLVLVEHGIIALHVHFLQQLFVIFQQINVIASLVIIVVELQYVVNVYTVVKLVKV